MKIVISHTTTIKYRIVGMFGRVDVWQIVELKAVREKKFGEYVDRFQS